MQIQAIRGMNDVLPGDMGPWQQLEATARELLASYGYEEIRVPIVEHTELFKRAIGEFTDVVEKEMYTFADGDRDSLTLRPEGTAGVVRAVISNGLLRGARLKLWCSGPMFRHERPQKGRYRQFHQISVEAIGFAGPDVDAEIIALSARLWKMLGISRVKLQINSLGTPESRRVYKEKLVSFFLQHQDQLDADSQRRLTGNPLRILDSKNPQMQALIKEAPLLSEHLDTESRTHFDQLCAALDAAGISYEINPRLVRGLDYYSRTVFEWITDALGAQDAICSGGRYDGLVAQLGGDPTPAIGFALGMERVVELMRLAGESPATPTADVYVIVSAPSNAGGSGAQSLTATAIALTEKLRDALPGKRIELNLGGGNFKAQFRRADKSGARIALILGEDELRRGVAALKPLRSEAGQSEYPITELPAQLAAALR